MKLRLQHSGFWWLIIGLVFAYFIPNLFQKGMFLDGVTYASISKNLANGIGDTWHLQYTQTFNKVFQGHPPGMFIIESFFFKLFGDSYYVEKLFSLCCAIATITGIILLWKQLSSGTWYTKHAWLPIIFWITTYANNWAFQNNMLECLVTPLMLFAVYLYIRSMHTEWWYIIPATLCVWYAYFVKGPVSLFPLITIGAYWLVFRNKSFLYAAITSIASISIFIGSWMLLFIIEPDAYTSMQAYHNLQVFSAVTGTNEITTQSHLSIITDFGFQILPMIIVLGIFTVISYKKITNTFSEFKLNIIFFVLIGLAGVLPIMLTLKQRFFYMVPALPFFAIAGGLYGVYCISNEHKTISKKTNTILTIIGITICIVSVSIGLILRGSYSRDKNLITDIEKISHTIGKQRVIECSRDLHYDWKLIAYSSRISNISIYPHSCDTAVWKICGVNSKNVDLIGYTKHKLTLESYILYKKN